VVPKGRHTRCTSKLHLETPEDDPENIIKKVKTSQEGLSAAAPGDFGNLHDSSFKSPIVVSNSPSNLPRNRMDSIVATRYAPLVLPQPMNALPVRDYLK
jgi:hypothetical protein